MPKVFLIKRILNKVIEDSAVSGYEQFKTKISVPQERDKKMHGDFTANRRHWFEMFQKD